MDVYNSNSIGSKVSENKQENQENVVNQNNVVNVGSSSSSNSSSSVLDAGQQEDGETLSMSFPPRHLQHRYQTAETTQLVSISTIKPNNNFKTGTQFLSNSYLGETPVLLPVWSNVGPAGPTSSSAGIKEEIREGKERQLDDRYQESKIEFSEFKILIFF